ncbi:MAG: PAS domain S-box protein [Gammaproteobacteria bacterium]|nr:PAS domain S-box protein [Gammaproteobacteria bacterium]
MTKQRDDLLAENARLKQSLAELSKERDKYKKLFDVSADALSIIDVETGTFIECNQSAVDIHGVEASDNFLNLKPSDLSPEFQPCGRRSDELAGEYIQQTLIDGAKMFQWTHSRLDGSTFPCLVSLTAMSIDGKQLILAIGRDITDLMKTQKELEKVALVSKQHEQAFLKEKEKFETFVNRAPIGIALNSIVDGRFEFVNQEFVNITGYSAEELNQMDYWQLTPKKYEQQEFEQVESLNTTGQYGPYLKEYIDREGQFYPVLLSGVKITDSSGNVFIWSVVLDMTQQKKIEQQIQESKNKADALALRMQLANDSAGIGVWDWDLVTGELVWDDWMYKLYGISADEFSGAYEAWVNSVHPEDIERAKSNLEAAIEGTAVYEPEFRVVHANGDVRTLKASAEVLRNEKGQAIKVVGVNYDVTEKINALEVLSEAKLAAENAVKAKSDFLANMSHEIRTPMNAILGGLQLLKDADLSPQLSRILGNAAFSAQSLLTIINDILDYSKIEANNLSLETIQFSLTEVLESVKYDLDATVSAKRIEFVINKSNSFVEYWLGDLVRVKQIILNLASNAVKFTEQGSVEVNIGTSDFNGKQAISFEVKDSGIGMSKEAIERIFERFAQADASTTRKYGGTGLGMSITTSLIKMMGGEIDVASIEGAGTTVSVLLPLKPVDFAVEKKIEKSLSAPNLASRRILIAEDNDINKVLIESMLKATQADLTIVENGQLAVEAVQSKDYDVVLMDIHMPVMDGTEAQQLIQSAKPNLPVIALTANVMKSDVEGYLKQGFVAHIAKPIDINDLYGVLKNQFR